jgi:hypothetical protein
MQARDRLDAGAIFAKEAGGLDVHKHYEAIRDKHVFHDENGLAGVVIGAAFAPDAPDGPISEIVALQYRAHLVNDEFLNPLIKLVRHVLGWVDSELDRQSAQLRQELSSEGLEAALKRPDLQWKLELEKIGARREF